MENTRTVIYILISILFKVTIERKKKFVLLLWKMNQQIKFCNRHRYLKIREWSSDWGVTDPVTTQQWKMKIQLIGLSETSSLLDKSRFQRQIRTEMRLYWEIIRAILWETVLALHQLEPQHYYFGSCRKWETFKNTRK